MSGFIRSSRALYSAAKAAEISKPKVSTRVATAATPKKTKPAAEKKPRSGDNNPLCREIPVSPILGSFVGASQISRSQATKKIWEYIKQHDLQNPTNKREIFCDDTLKKLFDGKDKVGMLEIAKLLSPHFVKAASS